MLLLAVVARQELAWSSFALLKNVNCCSVLLLQPGSAQSASTLMARGAVSSSCVAPGDSKASLQRVSQVGAVLAVTPLLHRPSVDHRHAACQPTLQQPQPDCCCVMPGLQSLASSSSRLLPGGQQQWLADRSALQQSGLGASGCVPEGVESALVQAVPGGALLLVLAERPR